MVKVDEFFCNVYIEKELIIGKTKEEKGKILMINSENTVVKLEDKDFIEKFGLSTKDFIGSNYQPINKILTDLSNLDITESGLLKHENGKWIFDNSDYLVAEKLNEYVKKTDSITINNITKELGNNPIFSIDTKSNLTLGVNTKDYLELNNDNGTSVVLNSATEDVSGLMSADDKRLIKNATDTLDKHVLLKNKANKVTEDFTIQDNNNKISFNELGIDMEIVNGKYTFTDSHIKYTNELNDEILISVDSGIKSTYKGNKFGWSIEASPDTKSNLILPSTINKSVIPLSVNGIMANSLGDIIISPYVGSEFIDVTDKIISLKNHTHKIDEVDGLQDILNAKSDLESPNFIGNPTSPTPSTDDVSKSIATTEFVNNQEYLKIANLPTTLPNEESMNVILRNDNDVLVNSKYDGTEEFNLNIQFGENVNAELKNDSIVISTSNNIYTSSKGIDLDGNNFTPKYGNSENTIAQGNDERFHVHGNKNTLDKISEDTLNDLKYLKDNYHNHDNLDVLNDITDFDVNKWNENSNNSHSHTNKEVLDKISQNDLDNLNDVNNKKHIHNNKSTIDKITETNLTNWNDANSKKHTHINKEVLDNIKIGDVDNWNDSNVKKHTHDNKNILDKIDETFYDSIESSISISHTHDNKNILDKITESNYDNWNDADAKKHIHDNKNTLDKIDDNLLDEVNDSIIKKHIHNNKEVLDNINSSNIDSWNEASSSSHIHDNIDILDDIEISDINNWNDADSKKHVHDNKDVLDNIKNLDINNWNDADSKKHTHHNLEVLESIKQSNLDEWNYAKDNSHNHTNKDVLDVLNTEDITNWNDANTKKHVHDNKEILDNINQEDVDRWNNTSTVNHTHDNKEILDSISDLKIKNWDIAFDKSHSHTNKAILDSISQTNINDWNKSSRASHVHDNKDVLDKVTEIKVDNWTEAYNKRHIHYNKKVLDNINKEDVNNWNDANTKSHIHTNKDILDNIKSEDIANWDDANAKKHIHDNKTTLDKITEDLLNDLVVNNHTHVNKETLDKITEENYNNWNDANDKKHVHDNKDVLDNIKIDDVNNWDDANSKKHIHVNKDILDNIKSEDIANWDDANAKKHIHDNIILLDGLSDEDIINWNDANAKKHTHNNKPILDNIKQSDIDRWDDVSNQTHNHDNKEVLDKITQTNYDNWNDANDKKHTHDNKDILDGIKSEDITNWNDANSKKHIHDNKDILDGIKSEDITNWNDANDKKHTHTNKEVLDTIKDTDIVNWNDANSKKHTHTNKDILDGIKSEDITNWNDANSKKHTHANKTTIDKITETNLTNWNDANAKKHTHVNKNILDTITQEQLDKWNIDYLDLNGVNVMKQHSTITFNSTTNAVGVFGRIDNSNGELWLSNNIKNGSNLKRFDVSKDSSSIIIKGDVINFSSLLFDTDNILSSIENNVSINIKTGLITTKSHGTSLDWFNSVQGNHSHTNKEVLDEITQNDVDRIRTSVYGDNLKGTVDVKGNANNPPKRTFFYRGDEGSGAIGINIQHPNNETDGLQIQALAYNNPSLKVRTKRLDVWTSWRELWDKTNLVNLSQLNNDINFDGRYLITGDNRVFKSKSVGADLNLQRDSVIYSTGANRPSNINSTVITLSGLTDYGFQIASRNENIWFRGYENAEWKPWRSFWHAGNLSNPATQTWVNEQGFSKQTLTANNGITISATNVIEPKYGSIANTVAQGNDSRIINGQTAFTWGDFRTFGLGVGGVDMSPSTQLSLNGSQFIRASSGANSDFNLYGAGIQMAMGTNSLRIAQLFIPINKPNESAIKYRIKDDGTVTSIRTVWDNNNLKSISQLELDGTVFGKNNTKIATSIGIGNNLLFNTNTIIAFGNYNKGENFYEIGNGTSTSKSNIFSISNDGMVNVTSGLISSLTLKPNDTETNMNVYTLKGEYVNINEILTNSLEFNKDTKKLVIYKPEMIDNPDFVDVATTPTIAPKLRVKASEVDLTIDSEFKYNNVTQELSYTINPTDSINVALAPKYEYIVSGSASSVRNINLSTITNSQNIPSNSVIDIIHSNMTSPFTGGLDITNDLTMKEGDSVLVRIFLENNLNTISYKMNLKPKVNDIIVTPNDERTNLFGDYTNFLIVFRNNKAYYKVSNGYFDY